MWILRKKPKVYLNELEREKSEIVHLFNGFISHFRTKDGKITLLYLWDKRARRDFRKIKRNIKKTEFIFKSLHKFYKKNNKRYKKEIYDIERLLKLLNKVKPDQKWLEEMNRDLHQIISDIEGEIKEYGISRREFFTRSVGITSAIVALGGISAKLVESALVEEASKLPANNEAGLAILISRPGNLFEKFGSYFINGYTAVFGMPIFSKERISYWMRITSPVDFFINPFADKKCNFDRYSSKLMSFAEKLIARYNA